MSQYSGEPASMRRAVSKTRPSAHSTGYGAQTNASVSASPNAATAAIAGPTNDGMDRSGVPEAARLSTIDDHVRIFIRHGKGEGEGQIRTLPSPCSRLPGPTSHPVRPRPGSATPAEQAAQGENEAYGQTCLAAVSAAIAATRAHRPASGCLLLHRASARARWAAGSRKAGHADLSNTMRYVHL